MVLEPVPGPEVPTTPENPASPIASVTPDDPDVPDETPAPGEPTDTPAAGSQTNTPGPGEPTKTAAERNRDVLVLPSTGSGETGSGAAFGLMMGTLGIILLAAFVSIRRSRPRR